MPAKTKRPTQEEMKARIARFKDLVSTKACHGANKGVPVEVMAHLQKHFRSGRAFAGDHPGQGR